MRQSASDISNAHSAKLGLDRNLLLVLEYVGTNIATVMDVHSKNTTKCDPFVPFRISFKLQFYFKKDLGYGSFDHRP